MLLFIFENDYIFTIMYLKFSKRKVKTNSILILFLFFFFLPLHTFHYVFLMPFLNNILIFLFIHAPLIFPWETVLCTVCTWTLHTAHPFFFQSGWRPSGRAHYFTIFAFTKPEAPPFKQCTP